MATMTLGEASQLTGSGKTELVCATTDATTDTLVATLREQLAAMRQDRDHWRGVALGITRQVAETTTRQVVDQRERRAWWHRFRMTG
jgi:hypothetical protein